VPLLKPGKQGVLIVPIAMHWFDKDGENVHEANIGTIDKVLDDAPDLIRQAVIDIHAYWRARGRQPTTH
jgi:D-lyxose ketol-isomerase